MGQKLSCVISKAAHNGWWLVVRCEERKGRSARAGLDLGLVTSAEIPLLRSRAPLNLGLGLVARASKLNVAEVGGFARINDLTKGGMGTGWRDKICSGAWSCRRMV